MTTFARVQRTSGSDITELARELRSGLAWLRTTSSERLLSSIERIGHELVRRPDAMAIEGAAHLGLWLRTNNLRRLLERSLPGGPSVLDDFRQEGDRPIYVKAQPAGLVCHWVAGNVPTLAAFSAIVALVTKNVSLVRVAQDSIESTEHLLRIVTEALEDDATSREVLQRIRFIHFDRDDERQHELLSSEADCRVLWGGEAMMDRIRNMPRQLHCNDIVFGPKYSIGVIGHSTCVAPDSLRTVVTAFVRDILAFDQRACSSPQTIFLEGDRAVGESVMECFAEAFREAAVRRPKRQIDPATAILIHRKRAEWGVHPDRSFRAAKGADWTVCLDDELSLKEAVQSRTIFLTVVPDLMEVIDLLGPRIQTVGLAIEDRQRALSFADAATARGVSRCVAPGAMDGFDLPWDGQLVLSELVRWATVKL